MIEDVPTYVPLGEDIIGVECMSESQMKQRFGRHALHCLVPSSSMQAKSENRPVSLKSMTSQ